MIGPADIREKVLRQWRSGNLLRAYLNPSGEDAQRFPWAIPFKKPKASEWLEQFSALRAAVEALVSGSEESGRRGYRIEWQQVQHRKLGEQRLPARIVVPSPEDALTLVGKTRQAKVCAERVNLISARFPALATWCDLKPLTVLEFAADWERLLAVLERFVSDPKPGCYLRQLDIPEVDTKFIEHHRTLLAELLELVLPDEATEPSRPLRAEAWFEHRFGLRYELPRVRVCGAGLVERHGLHDATLPIDALARRPLGTCVFVVENTTTGVALRAPPDSVVFMGLGNAVTVLETVSWLRDVELHYWGDIDTHGLAILGRLRRLFPHARSFLMDAATLREHEHLAVGEATAATGSEEWLAPLTAEERALACALLPGGEREGARLEQERIPMPYVDRRLAELLETARSAGASPPQRGA